MHRRAQYVREHPFRIASCGAAATVGLLALGGVRTVMAFDVFASFDEEAYDRIFQPAAWVPYRMKTEAGKNGRIGTYKRIVMR